jgi:hypothetical protein
LVKDKRLRIKPRYASPRDPRESNKRLLNKKQEGPLKKIIKQDLTRGYGISSQASLLGPWVPSSMTLPSVGHHARAVTFGCMAKGKGVSSRASLLISVKVLVGNAVITGHHARIVSLDYLLSKKNKKKQ